ncbi:MAG: ATPase P [Thermodesulfobacteriota bacterium]|nr:ATPase P [Thermodesulfobacteriota bacterium]
MIELNIPGRETLIIKHLILDLNGTIALDGEIIEGVRQRLKMLSRQLDIVITTADTTGRAVQIIEDMVEKKTDNERPFSVKLYRIEKEKEDIQKLELVKKLGMIQTISIGNGSNDALMLKESAIGICIIGKEGSAVEAVMSADLLTFDIKDSLDLLMIPQRMVATLRK